ncbi:MAG: acylphosphatase [Bacteroidetes bacterium]|nr:acylphosphatase [Bacteroidota bacterium]MCL5026050.1 acylphosphatase [Chloroflexota bacterium]
MAKVRYRVLISGRVQGVNFRSAMRSQAISHYVGGWVRNLGDGRVEAVLEGEKEDVEQVVAWARHGPPAAYVADVQATPEPYRGESEGFYVRYAEWS